MDSADDPFEDFFGGRHRGVSRNRMAGSFFSGFPPFGPPAPAFDMGMFVSVYLCTAFLLAYVSVFVNLCVPQHLCRFHPVWSDGWRGLQLVLLIFIRRRRRRRRRRNGKLPLCLDIHQICQWTKDYHKTVPKRVPQLLLICFSNNDSTLYAC